MVRVPDAKTDCSRRGEAEVRILNFKTSWSEFQMPSQTAPAEAKPRCVYSILKPHGQSSRCQARLLPCEAKPSYVHTILKNIPPQSQSHAIVCVSTPRMYPHSGYFLVKKLFTLIRSYLCLWKKSQLPKKNMVSNSLYYLGLEPIGQLSQVSFFGPIIFHGAQSSISKRTF